MENQLQKVQGSNHSLVRLRDEQVMTESFETFINGVCFSIGISKALNRLELNVVYNFIRSEFGGFSIREMNEAFNKYAAGKLSFKTSHYDKFDNRFIGNVLSSYSEFKAKVVSGNKVVSLPGQKIKYSEKEGLESYEFIKKVYSETGGEPIIANWSYAFRYMESNKIIEYSDDEKEMFKENVIEGLREEMSSLRLARRNYSHIMDMLNKDSMIKAECRKRILIAYFENENN